MNRDQKQSARDLKAATVKSLAEKISRAKTMAFVDYQGLSVNQINDLRNKVKLAGGELIVAKNTLMSRALSTNHLGPQSSQTRRGPHGTVYALSTDNLIGPAAAVFSYDDEISAVKTIADAAKTTGIPKFKFGFFGKDFLDAVAIETLAKIPSRQELQAKVVSALASPLYGIVNVLQANIRNLASVLDQIAKKGV